MRKNKYVVCSELPNGVVCYNSLNNKYILLSLRMYKIFQFDNIDFIKSTERQLYDLLIRNKFIVENEYCEEKIADLRRLNLKLDTSLYHIVINSTLNCNLNCWYCYETKSENSNLRTDVIEKIKKNIALKFKETRFKNLKISFFGGEPLLNFKGIKEVCDFCKEFCEENSVDLLVDFTTNATLINNQLINYLSDFNTSFQITLDGCKDAHNKIRFNKKTNIGTYDTIVHNIKTIVEKMPNSYVWIRINFDKSTLKNISDIIKDIQYIDKKRCSIILRKVWQVDINDIDKKDLNNAIDALMEAGFFVDYHALPRINPCFAERFNQASINYDGNIFKCTTLEKFDNENAVGRFNDNGEIIFNLSKVANSVIYNPNKFCRECGLYPSCYGPCGQKNKDKDNFKCILNNLGMTKEELVIHNFKLKLLNDKIYEQKEDATPVMA